jgi:hypothetical protein
MKSGPERVLFPYSGLPKTKPATDMRATTLPEASHNEMPPRPAEGENRSSFQPSRKKKAWIPWVIGTAALLVLAGILWGIFILTRQATPTPTVMAPTKMFTFTSPSNLGIGSSWAHLADNMVMVYVRKGGQPGEQQWQFRRSPRAYRVLGCLLGGPSSRNPCLAAEIFNRFSLFSASQLSYTPHLFYKGIK